MAMIYYVLDSYYDLSEGQKLYATALFDMIYYFENGKILPANIEHAVVYCAGNGIVNIGLYKNQYGTDRDDSCNKYLRNLTMQVEALCFALEETINIDTQSIINCVIEHKKRITDVINTTLEEGHNCELFDSIYKNVTAWMQEKQYQDLISGFTFDI